MANVSLLFIEIVLLLLTKILPLEKSKLLWKRATDDRIIEIQEKLNNRPRKRFNFETTNSLLSDKNIIE